MMSGVRISFSFVAILLLGASVLSASETKTIPMVTCSGGNCSLASGVTPSSNYYSAMPDGVGILRSFEATFRKNTAVFPTLLPSADRKFFNAFDLFTVNQPLPDWYVDSHNWLIKPILETNSNYLHQKNYPQTRVAENNGRIYVVYKNILGSYLPTTAGALGGARTTVIDAPNTGTPVFKWDKMFLPVGNTVRVYGETATGFIEEKRIETPDGSMPVTKLMVWNDYLVMLAGNAIYMHPVYAYEKMSEEVVVEGEIEQIALDERISLPAIAYDFTIENNNLIIAENNRIHIIEAIDGYNLSDFSGIDFSNSLGVETIESSQHDCIMWNYWWGGCLEYDEGVYLDRIRSVLAQTKNNELIIFVADSTGFKTISRNIQGTAWERRSTVYGYGPSEGMFIHNNRIYVSDWFSTLEYNIDDPSDLWRVSVTANGSSGTYAVLDGRLFMGGWGRVKSYAVENVLKNNITFTLPQQTSATKFTHVWFAPETTWPATAVLQVKPQGQSTWQTIQTGQIASIAVPSTKIAVRVKMTRQQDTSALMKKIDLVLLTGEEVYAASQYKTCSYRTNEEGELQKLVEFGDPISLTYQRIARKDIAHDDIPGVLSWTPEVYYTAATNRWDINIPRAIISGNPYSRTSGLWTNRWLGDKLILELPWGTESYINREELDDEHLLHFLRNAGTYQFIAEPGSQTFANVEVTVKPYGGLFSEITIKRWATDNSYAEFYYNGGDGELKQSASAYAFATKITAPNGTQLSFDYVTEEANTIDEYPAAIKKITVNDSAGRVIRIEAAEGSTIFSKPELIGHNSGKVYPHNYAITKGFWYKGAGDYQHVNFMRDDARAEYSIIPNYNASSAWSATAVLYKDGQPHRTDTYNGLISNTCASNGTDCVKDFPIHGTIQLSMSSNDGTALPAGDLNYTVKLSQITNIQQALGTTGELYETNYSLVIPSSSPSDQDQIHALYETGLFNFSTQANSNEVWIRKIIERENWTVKRTISEYYSGWRYLIKREICSGTNSADCLIEEFSYDEEGNVIRNILPDGRNKFYFYDRNGVSSSDYVSFYQQNPDLHDRAGNMTYSVETKAAYGAVYAASCSDVRFTSDDILPQCYKTVPNGQKKVTKYYYNGRNDLHEVVFPDERKMSFNYDYEEGGIRFIVIRPIVVLPPQIFYPQPMTTVLPSPSLTPSIYNRINWLINEDTWSTNDINGDGITFQFRGNLIKKEGEATDESKLAHYFSYDGQGRLAKQGILKNNAISYIREYTYRETEWLPTEDHYLIAEESHYPSYYLFDNYGRRIAEKNSTGSETFYLYDDLDRVKESYFGCQTTIDYVGDPTAPDYSSLSCAYKRVYDYDALSDLTDIKFEEKSVVADESGNPRIKSNMTTIIHQKTFYDVLGRAYLSCQKKGILSDNPYDVRNDLEARCIETAHDRYGNITEKVENGVTRHIAYNYLSLPTNVIENNVLLETSTYTDGRLSTLTNKYDKTTSFTYDDWGRKWLTTDPFGQAIAIAYDDANRSNRVKGAYTYAPQTSGEYCTASNLTACLLTGNKEYEYDTFGRKWKEHTDYFIPEKGYAYLNHRTTTEYEYDDLGNIIATSNNLGNRRETYYDDLNRVKEVISYSSQDISSTTQTCYYGYNDPDMQNDCENFTEPATGRIAATISTIGGKTIWNVVNWYDMLGRPLSTCKTNDGTQENARCSYSVYNTGGQIIWSADEEADTPRTLPWIGFEALVGNETFYQYNAFGQTTKIFRKMTQDGMGGDNLLSYYPYTITAVDYDRAGRVTSRINHRGGHSDYLYDPVSGLLTNETIYPAEPEPEPEQSYDYSYNDKGDLYSTEYTNGAYSASVFYLRDEWGRISKKAIDDVNNIKQTFSYNERNLLASAVDSFSGSPVTIERSYDSMGNVWQEITDYGDSRLDVKSYWPTETHHSIYYPDGDRLTKSFNGNQLKSVIYGSPAQGTVIAAQYEYNDGLIDIIKKGNNLIEEKYTYNQWRKLETLVESVNDTPVKSFEYKSSDPEQDGYTRAWHLKEKKDSLAGRTENYVYDSIYRLNQLKVNGGVTEEYGLDGVSNIWKSTENGVEFDWSVDGFNRLKRKSNAAAITNYDYDERNNMIAETGTDGREFMYDDLNRLTEAWGENEVNENVKKGKYIYDAFSRRVAKQVFNGNGNLEKTHRYVYDGWNILAEYITDAGTNTTTHVNYIDTGMDGHLAMVPNGDIADIEYFLTDERGNVVAIADASGDVMERYRYGAYGNVTIMDEDFHVMVGQTRATSPFLWGGSYRDDETGFYWMRNRYYHIGMKRFINQDPIGIWGDANNLGNGFAYVSGMVIEHTDPTGLEVWMEVTRLFENDQAAYSQVHVYSDLTGESWSGYGMEGKGNPASPGAYEGYPVYHHSPYRVEYTKRYHQWHEGNYPWDTVGCIVPGNEFDYDIVDKRKKIRDKTNKNYNKTALIYMKGSGNAMQQIRNIINHDPGKIFTNIALPPEVKPEPEQGTSNLERLITRFTPQKVPGATVEAGGAATMVNGETSEGEPFSNESEMHETYDIYDEEGNLKGYVVVEDDCIYIVDENGKVTQDNCEGEGCADILAAQGEYPSSPDDPADKFQSFLAMQMINRMLLLDSSDNMTNKSTIRRIGGNDFEPSILFYRNPFYRPSDPMRAVILGAPDDTGRRQLYRNPMVPGGGGYSSGSAAADLFNSSFNPGNIDPWDL